MNVIEICGAIILIALTVLIVVSIILAIIKEINKMLKENK